MTVKLIVIILGILILSEITLKPRLDLTPEKNLILWLGIKNRMYVVIW